MIEAIRNGEDLHRLAAAALYAIDVEEVTKIQRQHGKIFNFAVLYGASANKIAQMYNVSKREAERLIQNYFNVFTGLKAFQERTFQESLERGYILVDKLGRRSYLPDFEEYLRSNSSKLYSQYFRLNANYQIQGTAASMSKFAGVLLREALKGTSAKIVLLVHDEWVVECDESESTKIKAIVECCMAKSSNYFAGGLSIAEALCNKSWLK